MKFGGKDYNIDDLNMEKLKASMTDQEWIKIYDMSNDKNLLSNLCQSLFPMIYGNNFFKLFGCDNLNCLNIPT